MSKFTDGIVNIVNALRNKRSATETNRIYSRRMDWQEMQECWRTGLGNKIIRKKVGRAMAADAIHFPDDSDQKDTFDAYFADTIFQASSYMLGFGRGIILINEKGADHSQPKRGKFDINNCRLTVFSGDMVTVSDHVRDLSNPRYMLPKNYNVRGHQLHWTRVIDFRYVLPVELELPLYQYGGVSEFELIRPQMIADATVQRASADIIERNSTSVFKYKGMRSAIQAGQEKEILKYHSMIEDSKSLTGSVLIDAEDDAVNVSQTLSNLNDVDQITLRRLAMVTGLPVSELVGENVKGLNSTGDNERQTMNETIEALQNNYILPPSRELLDRFGIECFEFRTNQHGSAEEKAAYDKMIIENAFKLAEMGEDYGAYLDEHGIITKDEFEEFFREENQRAEVTENAGAEVRGNDDVHAESDGASIPQSGD